MELKLAKLENIDVALKIIDEAKEYLKNQGIDQWQNGYPDYDCIKSDILLKKGYFIVGNNEVYGYLCIDFDGEPAYDTLEGSWNSDEKYVVVHRLALSSKTRGKGTANKVFELAYNICLEKNVHNFRIDTDADNIIMQHILKKNDFKYCGTICFDNSEKIAFDKIIK